jgi:hypothetical protein
MARGSPPLVRRGLLAAVLAGAALIPSQALGLPSLRCPGRCGSAGTIRWTRLLPGSWVAKDGIGGTVPSEGEAYAAIGSEVAAVGFGMTVDAFQARTGDPLWTTALAGFPAGSSIVSVRAWPGTITAGVIRPAASIGGPPRTEVVLGNRTGRQIRKYPAAAYGGVVAAGNGRTVVVGPASVTSYDNATGKATWDWPTGAVPQAWRVDGSVLYVTVGTDGYLGAAPVTALRRINLATGTERVIRPAGGSFAGTLSGAFGGVVLFSGAGALTAYSGQTGHLIWQLQSALPGGVDDESGTLYVAKRDELVGIDPQTGARIGRSSAPESVGLYGIRGGVAIGLDLGALGDAWGYDVAGRRVVWTTPALPWPHYFVDLSGIGGSADPASSTVLLTTCAEAGAASSAGTGPVCLRAELAAVNR